MIAKLIALPTVAVTCMLLTGCPGSGTSKKSWTNVLWNCADTDTIPKNRMLYLSPSNSIGPGSVWKLNADGVYALRFTLDDAIADPAKRKDMVVENNPATCEGTHERTWSLKPSVLLSTDAAPIEADLSADINRSTKTTVSVSSWRWILLKELIFEQWSKSDTAGIYGKEASMPGRLIMTRAVQVDGFKAEMEFSTEIAAKLQAKFPLGGTTPFKVGAGLEASWKDNLTLVVTSKDPFFMAGALRPVGEDGSINFLGAMEDSEPIEAKVPSMSKQITRIEAIH